MKQVQKSDARVNACLADQINLQFASSFVPFVPFSAFDRAMAASLTQGQTSAWRERMAQAERERNLAACVVLQGAKKSATNGVQVGQWHLSGDGSGKSYKGLVRDDQADVFAASLVSGLYVPSLYVAKGAVVTHRRVGDLAWRAAYASLTELPNGMRGPKSAGVKELLAPSLLDSIERKDGYRGEDLESSEVVGVAGSDMAQAIEAQLAALRQRGLVEAELARQAGVFVEGGGRECFESIDGVTLRKRQVSGQVEVKLSRAEWRKANPVKANSFEVKTACKMIVKRLLHASWAYQKFILWGDSTPNNLVALRAVKSRAKLICLVLRGVDLREAAVKCGLKCFGTAKRFAYLLQSIGVDKRGLASAFAKGY